VIKSDPNKNDADPEKKKIDTYNISPEEFWFETGAMVGGSRNQLDLGRSSHYKNIPGGGISMFGVDTTTLKKDHESRAVLQTIDIVFDGVNYAGNEIVYPVSKQQGKNKKGEIKKGKSNGTFRLQIKGRALDGKKSKITSVISKTDFQHKIMVFKKLSDLEFEMSLVNFDEHIDDIKSKSAKIDKANAQARQFGIIKE